MKIAAGRTRKFFWLLAGIAGLVLAPAGAAWAQKPSEVFTQVSTFSDHFSGPGFPCQDESYDVTVTIHDVLHYNYYSTTDTFHAHFSDHGSVVAVPVDGTGPTYKGTFSDLDSDNIRAVRHGDVLVQKDTDLMRSIAHGSDGSRVFVMTHAQLTINANGETTVEFEIDKMVCS
jgi:hypothetical protein